MTGPLLDIRRLSTYYVSARGTRVTRAVDEVTLSLDQGQTLGIVAKMCDQVAVMYAGRLVEAGPVKQIYNAPAHPYTRALLESIPRLGDSRSRLTAIDGQPPDPSAPPPGCAFHPRCPKIMDRCRSEVPPEFRVADAQTSRCWLAAPATR